ncbi:hypothetical protein OG21DRAFT_1489908 [Imleria badia]|nr:hypothetical protein OG21DRAFT_1489908 [Imleria badia]
MNSGTVPDDLTATNIAFPQSIDSLLLRFSSIALTITAALTVTTVLTATNCQYPTIVIRHCRTSAITYPKTAIHPTNTTNSTTIRKYLTITNLTSDTNPDYPTNLPTAITKSASASDYLTTAYTTNTDCTTDITKTDTTPDRITPLRLPTSAHKTDSGTNLTTTNRLHLLVQWYALNTDQPTDILTISDTPTDPDQPPTDCHATFTISEVLTDPDIPTDLWTMSKSVTSDHSALRHDQRPPTASPTPMYQHTSRLHLLLSLHSPVCSGHYILPPNLHPCTPLPFLTTADDQEVII